MKSATWIQTQEMDGIAAVHFLRFAHLNHLQSIRGGREVLAFHSPTDH